MPQDEDPCISGVCEVSWPIACEALHLTLAGMTGMYWDASNDLSIWICNVLDLASESAPQNLGSDSE